MRADTLILMYHDIAPAGEPVAPERGPYVLDREVFRRHVAAIRGSGHRVLTLEDWALTSGAAGGPRKGAPVPARGSALSLVLTFDDGDASNFTHALPLLQEGGLTATFLVTVGRIGDPGYLTWNQIFEMQRAGMEIGSHTLTHRPPRSLGVEELRFELEESKKRLEDRLGRPVVSLSSPTGFFNARMSAIARESGYAVLCVGRIGSITAGADRYALPRVPIKRGISDAGFAAILEARRSHLMRLRAGQMVRNGLKRILGPGFYLALRRRILGARAWR